MKSPRLTAVLAVMLLLLVTFSSALAAGEQVDAWHQDFDSNVDGWLDNDDLADFGDIEQVPSGGGDLGVTSADGTGHAELEGTPGENGPFSRFDHYRGTWPGTWTAEIDVYLDPDNWLDDSGFDYSVASNGSDGNHRRDFIFHVSRYDLPNRIVVAGSNNSNFAPRQDLESLANHFVVDASEAGWYTLQHKFYAVAGVLAVDLNLLDEDGNILFTETRSDVSDTIPAVVGGNRYAWFTFIDGGPIAVDNHEMVIDPLWFFYDDGFPGGTGEFVVGPATPPLGKGSLHFTLVDDARMNYMTAAYAGTRLDELTELEYSTYQASSGVAAVSLQFNIDYDLTDSDVTWQGRLTYEPYHSETVLQNQWQTWDPLAGEWWSSGSPGNGVCPQSNPCTWADVLTAFPDAGIRVSDGYLLLRAGGPAAGFDGNADALTIGVNGVSTTFDFEPTWLDIEDDALNMHGQSTFEVPVYLYSGNNDVSATSFTVAWDQACLAFDSVTDSNNDGIPNSVTGLPDDADFDVTVTRNGTDQEVTILIKPDLDTPPLPTLTDGVVATLTFDATGCDSDGAVVPVVYSFPASTSPAVVPSFGNSDGESVDGATDGGTVTLTFNAIPSDITLDDNLVDENLPGGTTVGTLCTADDTPDGTDCAGGPGTFTYSLATGPGCASTGNFAFQVVGNELKTNGPLNREDVGGFLYDVCVESEDAYGLSLLKSFAIEVVDVNETPTDIDLDSTSVNENASVPTLVGNLSTTDEDDSDSHTYTLCSASPEFQFSGSTLETAAALDAELQGSYNVCIRSTDLGGLFVERTFTITVEDENDAPVAVDDPAVPPLVVVGDGNAVEIDVLANDTDEDAGDELLVNAIVDDADNGTTDITVDEKKVEYTADANYNGPDSFTYTAKDNDGAVSNVATVALNVVADDSRADCNADGQIDAADFPATVLEIFDTDDSIDWWKTYTGAFPGSPLGCDSNASQNGLSGTQPSVNSADIICTVLIFFGDNSCVQAVAAAANAQAGELIVQTDLIGAAGERVAVPVTLDTAGNRVAAATFVLTFDSAAASFDPTDDDGDGLPDAVTLNVPEQMATAVVFDAAANRIQVAVYGTSIPMPLVADGVLATIELELTGEAGEVSLTQASLGSDNGQSIPVLVDGVTAPTQGSGDATIFMPMLGQ